MQYNVAQLLNESTGSTRSYNMIEEFTNSGRVADRVAGQLRMLKTHQGVLVQVELEAWITDGCSRCDNEFPRTSELRIEEEFFPMVDFHPGRDLWPLPEDEGDLRIDVDHVLDLTEMMRQYTIGDIPMKPLCRKDCAGLCSLCGADLNQSHCDCNRTPGDPRLGVLADLLYPQKG